ncbi:MAG TPA: PAS domain S-box protein [Vicinamibacterales bacterium]|nr:PAS domain S-box protein [Vicinamibacterales bacterium]
MESQTDSIIQALRLAAIVEGSDDAIISKDVNGIIMSWNAAAERLFGYSAAEVIGQSIRTIIPADRQSEEDLVLGRIRRGERVDHFETQRCRRNGECFDVSITVSPIRTPDGTIVGASKIARDISERKRTERALAELRAEQADLRRRLSAIIESASALLMSPRLDDVIAAILVVSRQVLPSDGVAVWRLDAGQWRIAASHGVSERFVGSAVGAVGPRERLTDDLIEIESIDDERLGGRRAAYDAEGIVAMLVVPLQVGADLQAAISFFYRSVHQFKGVERESASGLGRLASAVIVTAQMYESQRRRRLESEFIADASAILVSALDFRDILTRLAESAVPRLADWFAVHLQIEAGVLEQVALATQDQDRRDSLETFARLPADDQDDAFSIDRVVQTGAAVLIERWPQEADPGLAPRRVAAAARAGVESLIVVPLVAHGRTLGAVTLGSFSAMHSFGVADLRFAQDLAYRVALSIDNIQSYEEARTANRLKDEFLANLSHELRTPLNAIVGYAQMLRKGALPEDRKVRAYAVLDKNASALTQIVEDVLDVSRIMSGKIRLQLRPVTLSPIVMQSIETVQPGADAKGVEIAVESADHDAAVAADADRLQQVFWNLLSNAVKFTPRGGRITIRVTKLEAACEVWVADNGAGVDPKFLPHIFERFRQADSRFGREHGGLGLGLAIARQIVEMHGGTITAESAGLGHGAAFRVLLPALLL